MFFFDTRCECDSLQIFQITFKHPIQGFSMWMQTDVNNCLTQNLSEHLKSDIKKSLKFTVDGLIFVVYQFSWFSWRVRSTNSSTHETAIFLYELWRKILMAMNFEPNECAVFVQSTKISTHENKGIHSTCLLLLLICRMQAKCLTLRFVRLKMWTLYFQNGKIRCHRKKCKRKATCPNPVTNTNQCCSRCPPGKRNNIQIIYNCYH